jgi:hypothetical protein
MITVIFSFNFKGNETKDFIVNAPVMISKNDFIGRLEKQDVDVMKAHVMQTDSLNLAVANNDVDEYISGMSDESYLAFLTAVPLSEEKKLDKGWDLFKHKIPMWIFIFVCITLTVLSVTKNLSLIPVLGVISCLYMMAQIELKNWIGFTIWLIVGLLIYFSYSYKNSKLNKVKLV